jgi:hypothetical protein
MKPCILVIAFLALAMGQDAAPEQKHLMLPTVNGARPVMVSALRIERGVEFPTVVKLSGNVEIQTPVCLPTGKKGAMVCDGDMILQADAAEFHEDTGQIEAHGNVTVTPLRHKK